MDRLSRNEREAAAERASDLLALLEKELQERLIVPTEVRSMVDILALVDAREGAPKKCGHYKPRAARHAPLRVICPVAVKRQSVAFSRSIATAHVRCSHTHA